MIEPTILNISIIILSASLFVYYLYIITEFIDEWYDTKKELYIDLIPFRRTIVFIKQRWSELDD
jgi:hypothetical protein